MFPILEDLGFEVLELRMLGLYGVPDTEMAEL